MSLITLDSETEIETQNDLRTLTDNEGMKAYVKSTYSEIDLKKTFGELVDCGKLLQIAYAAAGNQPCSVDILAILSKYQDAVHHSTITAHEFVQTSIKALNCHKEALELVELADDDEEMIESNEEAIAPLIQCYEYAHEMEKKALTAADKITELKELTVKAMDTTKKDTVRVTQENKELGAEIIEMKAQSKALEASAERYNNVVNKLEKEKDEAGRQAAEARSEANSFMGIIKDLGAAVVPVATMAVEGYCSSLVPTNNGGNEADMIDAKAKSDRAQSILESAETDKDKDTPEGRKKIKKAKQKLPNYS